jgi:hypothetical protein
MYIHVYVFIYYAHVHILCIYKYMSCRSQRPRRLRRRSAAARLLRSWVRIPPGACMFFCCEYCVLSGRGLCDELITRPEESYRMWCVVVCDLETSRMRRPRLALGLIATEKKSYTTPITAVFSGYFTLRIRYRTHVSAWFAAIMKHYICNTQTVQCNLTYGENK